MFSLLTMVRNVGEAHLVAAILIWSLIERRQVLGLGIRIVRHCSYTLRQVERKI